MSIRLASCGATVNHPPHVWDEPPFLGGKQCIGVNARAISILVKGASPEVVALLTNVPFCPFTEDGECIGGCPDAQHRACINGEDED
jgi:hypothetical protein